MHKAEPTTQTDRPLQRQARPEASREGPDRDAGPVAALQQRLGNAGLARALRSALQDRVQRRRVPSSAHLASALPGAADTVGVMNARTGLARVLSRSWASLTSAQQKTVQTAAAGFGIKFTDEASLLTALGSASRDQLTKFADEVRAADPARTLGDPKLIDAGPRPATSDAANIAKVVGNADAVFTTIAGGSKDKDIEEVFGSANVAAAKTKYANGATRMKALMAANKIVTDRSGYNDEVSLGGLTNSSQISVHSNVIDKPDDDESIVTMLHESMHAGNNDVHDFGYIHQPSFTKLAESVKLTNAAHFEVVPRRMKSMAFAFSGTVFRPAGTTSGGVTAPALTPREEAIRAASEQYRSAWTVGLNLHKIFVRLFKAPTEWDTLDLKTAFKGAPAGAKFKETLPFWSKVEGLTMHLRDAAINPAGAPAVQPVTMIDIALSEGLVRKLAAGMDNVPQTEADAVTFETTHATSAERSAAKTVTAERDLLIKLVVRVHLGSLTGSEARDLRVVNQMAQAATGSNFTEYLKVRPPSAFP